MPADAEVENIIENVDLDELFKLGIRFYKEKNGKGLHLSYQDNLKLVAYIKQVLHGPLSSAKAPEVGYFDVIGNDRREAWKQLKDMSEGDAKKDFIEILKVKCPSFLPYVAAQLKELEDFESHHNLANGHYPHNSHNNQPYNPDQKFLEVEYLEDLIVNQKFGDGVKNALYAQIYPQLQAYAQHQIPHDEFAQSQLIDQLAQQYWDKYCKQLSHLDTTQTPRVPLCNGHAHHTDSGFVEREDCAHVGVDNGSSQTRDLVVGNETDPTRETVFSNSLADGESSASQEANEEGVIVNASMWSRKDIKEFKDDVKKNHQECILKIGQGETVTIRVPTHEDGSSLFWEFATDHYDLAFGILFEWTEPASNKISITVTESSDEEGPDEEDELTEEMIQGMHKLDLETGNTVNEMIKSSSHDTVSKSTLTGQDYGSDAVIAIGSSKHKPIIPVDEIIPVYRRDCHTEVYAGTHPYPGRGVYLLKFDNSYSLWRSKTLYYKIYYTK